MTERFMQLVSQRMQLMRRVVRRQEMQKPTPRRAHGIVVLASVFLFANCTPGVEFVSGEELLVLEGATLIDGTGAPPLERSVIIIDGTRILRVGVVGEFDYPDDASVLDVSGRFVIPGLVNTHAHMFEGFPQLLLAFGITTVRNPGSGGDEGIPGASLGVSLRDRLAAGDVVGPRMVTAGRIINNSEVFSPLPGARGDRRFTAQDIEAVRGALEEGGFQLHPEKTRIVGPGGRQVVAGVVVNQSGLPPRETRRRWRAMFHRAHRFPHEFTGRAHQLRGVASFVNQYAPQVASEYFEVAKTVLSLEREGDAL